MKRQIIKIDREKCNGCGQCVPNCMEGALQIIDGKATLISDLMCDGLGACIGHCPLGAITIEEREAQPYDEVLVMKEIVTQGKNTVIAHLMHLKDHDQTEFLYQGIEFLKTNKKTLSFDTDEIIDKIQNNSKNKTMELNVIQEEHQHECGCPGSKTMSFKQENDNTTGSFSEQKSELTQWPVQMHLINPGASYFQNSDLVVAADCVAYSLGNFHQKYLKGKSLVIACPKLDSRQEAYLDKMVKLIDNAKVNTISVLIMEVPCCGGLLSMVQSAVQQANRKVPVKLSVVGIQGEILQEDWV